jgi:hypothetical protein
VTIGKDVGLNHDLLADSALNRKTASIDDWLYPLNYHSSPPRIRVHTASFPSYLLSKRHAKRDKERAGQHICHSHGYQRLNRDGPELCACAIASRAALADTGLCCAQKPAISAFVHRTFKVLGTPWAALIRRVSALEVKTVLAWVLAWAKRWLM